MIAGGAAAMTGSAKNSGQRTCSGIPESFASFGAHRFGMRPVFTQWSTACRVNCGRSRRATTPEFPTVSMARRSARFAVFTEADVITDFAALQIGRK